MFLHAYSCVKTFDNIRTHIA